MAEGRQVRRREGGSGLVVHDDAAGDTRHSTVHDDHRPPTPIERPEHLVVHSSRRDQQPVDAVLVHQPLEAQLRVVRPRRGRARGR